MMNICVQQSLVELWVDRDRRAGVHQASMPAQPEVFTDKNDPDVRDDKPPSQPQDRGDETCKRMLSSVIQKQIIPRLLQSEPKPGGPTAPSPAKPLKPRQTGGSSQAYKPTASTGGSRVSVSQVQAFAMMTVKSKANENLAFVEELLRQGLTESEIFLDLIGPAARFLGEQWEDDRVDFLEVTLGLVSMHELTHRLGYEYQAGPQTLGPTYRIMLSCVPGSMHLLGPVIVSSFFRAEGWQVVLEVSPTESELSHAVANEWFDVVGVSVSTSDQLTKLKQLVKVLKKSSRNPSLSVLAGGPIFLDASLSADKFGLDSICTDPQEAVQIAGGFARARSLG